ncbi:MAG: hypothetical protein MZU91_13025 [Desulfosudis oleivorans]|nr:hypothetical protein [Desulfosudis oleivorans]
MRLRTRPVVPSMSSREGSRQRRLQGACLVIAPAQARQVEDAAAILHSLRILEQGLEFIAAGR